MVSVTAFFAGLLGLLFVMLSVFVIIRRYKLRLPLGDGGDLHAQYRIRAHANFAEYVPFALLLIGANELGAAPKSYIISLGVLLVAGRLSHAFSLLYVEMTNPGRIYFRSVGMALTFTVITLASISAIF